MTSKQKNLLTISAIIVGVVIAGVALRARVISNAAESDAVEPAVATVSLLSIADFQAAEGGVRTVGEIESLEQVDLKSELSAKVVEVHVELGQAVTKGQLLVELDHSAIDAQLAQASATISRMQSSVNQRVAGATDEEIAQSAASVDAANAGLEQAKSQLAQTITSNLNAITSAELALATAEQNLKNNASSNSQNVESAYEDALDTMRSAVLTSQNALTTFTDVQYAHFYGTDQVETSLSQKKDAWVHTLLGAWNAGRWNNSALADLRGGVKGDVDALAMSSNPSNESIAALLDDVAIVLDETRSAMDALRGAMDGPGENISAAEKSVVDGSRSAVAAADTSLTNAKQAISGTQLSSTTVLDANQLAYEQAKTNLESTRAQADASIAAAESYVNIQEASVAQAEAAYNRVVADPRSVDLSGLYASVGEAQASYAQIQTAKEKAFIRAPFDGVVSVLPVSTGELVSGGMRVAGLVNDAGLQVKTHVNDQDRKLIAEGASVLIQGSIEGTVTHIAPSIDPETKKIEVRVAITDADAVLTIGEFVEVDIAVSADASGAPEATLPFQAVKTTTEGSYVFTVSEEGVIEAHEVELGRIVGDAVQVTSGLDPSWRIVSSTRAVRAGQKVNIGE